MPSEMTEELDLDRWQVIRALRRERFSFPSMIPVLTTLGLLECQETHRRRTLADGDEVCVTCENTLYVIWRRGLAKLGAAPIDRDAAKGEWIEDHELIAELCRTRAITKAKVTTTRTTEYIQLIEGKEVTTRDAVTTVRESVEIHPSLLRLLADVRDKMARLSGINVTVPGIGEPTPAPELHFHELENDGADAKPN